MSTIAPSIYFWCLLGIIISALLPSLWSYVRLRFPAASDATARTIDLPGFLELVRPYAALAVASALTALLVVAFLGDSLPDPRAAILAGYAWDSTLQKLRQ
jgi:hypothetical protein